MWERVDDGEEEAELLGASEHVPQVFERVDDNDGDEALPSPNVVGRPPKPLSASSAHSREGRLARAALMRLSIVELRARLRAAGSPCEDLTAREALAERLLGAVGPAAVLSELKPEDAGGETRTEARAAGGGGGSSSQAGHQSRSSCDYSKFNRIDYAKEYGIDEVDSSSQGTGGAAGLGKLPDLQGTPLEGLDPSMLLRGDLTDEERRKLLRKFMEGIEGKAGLKMPPPPPPPECHPVVHCAPPACFVDAPAESWMESAVADWPEDGPGQDSKADKAEIRSTPATGRASSEAAEAGGDSSEVWEVMSDEDVGETPINWQHQVDEDADCALEPPEQRSAVSRRIAEAYDVERRKFSEQARALEAVDVDGWGLEKVQLDLVEEMDEDLVELRILMACCQSEENKERLRRAIREFTLKLRERRTWAWFPLTKYTWTGFEFEKPIITLDFRVPGAGGLPAEDIHCDFGTDWFDLKIWNVLWPEDPGVKYHHRVKKTRLMRDIVPSESSVCAKGDHVCVKLQKVLDPRHGFCAWQDLAAGKGRKPFKYDEDAPDGGLMEFFEGEYEKHEGYDGFRRDIGKAMEKIHRCEPIRGISDTPDDGD